MSTVQSKDGTRIAYEQSGKGPPLIIVDGALCQRAMGPGRPLAARLNDDFTVYLYDRRGRGESGNASTYAIEREIEDIDALIQQAGGSAFVYGSSSGAALALEGAQRGLAIEKLALYEAPFIVDDSRDSMPADFIPRMTKAIAEDRRGDAVRQFMRFVGTPGFFVFIMRFMPVWSKLTAVAHTLPYDMTIVHPYEQGKPLSPSRWSAATMPTLVADGGKSPPWMRHGMQALARILPHAAYRTLEGQTHMLKPKAIAPVLVEFLNG